MLSHLWALRGMLAGCGGGSKCHKICDKLWEWAWLQDFKGPRPWPGWLGSFSAEGRELGLAGGRKALLSLGRFRSLPVSEVEALGLVWPPGKCGCPRPPSPAPPSSLLVRRISREGVLWREGLPWLPAFIYWFDIFGILGRVDGPLFLHQPMLGRSREGLESWCLKIGY